MRDQCKNCTLRGDLTQCKLTDCTQHDSWMVKQLERQLEEARKEIRNFILLEIEELKNIRNHTRFPEKSMNRCNRRIKELELKLKEHD